MKKCPSCGEEVPTKYKFCMNCGAQIVDEGQLSEEVKLRRELERSRLENELLQNKLDETRQDLDKLHKELEKLRSRKGGDSGNEQPQNTSEPENVSVAVSSEEKKSHEDSSGAVADIGDTSYEYVDLGLPSGLLWATCNIGADSPEKYGNYFAWGEISTKNEFNEDNYEYSDNPDVLPLSADAAAAKWGKGWRMPTNDDFEELLDECEWEWSKIKGVRGYNVIGPNGNTIFLPVAGYYVDDELEEAGSESAYMSSSICQSDSDYSWVLCLSSDSCEVNYEDGGRCYGYPVRAVRENMNKDKTSLVEKRTEAAHDYVDLGLPSGLLWATCNVGADSPEEYGSYFAWGETKTKRRYSDGNYCYAANPKILPPTADAAAVNWGDGWRMPTEEECEELWEECEWEWGEKEGIKGFIVTGFNENCIFLPATGYYGDNQLNSNDSCGYYWSSSLYDDDAQIAFRMFFEKGRFFSSGGCDIDTEERFYGMAVRPVKNR